MFTTLLFVSSTFLLTAPPEDFVRIEMEGKLRTGVVAIGGETTGVELTANGMTFEVALGSEALQRRAQGLDGQRVRLHGTLRQIEGVERGTRWIVTADSLEDAREAAIREALFALIHAAAREDATAACQHIVYRLDGQPARRWKSVYDPKNPNELAEARAICQRILSYLKQGSPTVTTFRTEKESEGEWLLHTVTFGEGENALRATFAWLAVPGGVALGDIDVER